MRCQDVNPNYVLSLIKKNERAKRKLEMWIELKLLDKKRTTTPKISHNEWLKTKTKKICFVDHLQLIDQVVVITCETIYNSYIMHDMTTHQDISVVNHISNMNTTQGNVNKSMISEYEPWIPRNNKWKDILYLSDFNDFKHRVM